MNDTERGSSTEWEGKNGDNTNQWGDEPSSTWGNDNTTWG